MVAVWQAVYGFNTTKALWTVRPSISSYSADWRQD